ncbi:hypothetical protein D9M68_813020 [compost metagenome]
MGLVLLVQGTLPSDAGGVILEVPRRIAGSVQGKVLVVEVNLRVVEVRVVLAVLSVGCCDLVAGLVLVVHAIEEQPVSD